MLLYGFAQELKRCLAISRSSDEGLKHFAFMIDGAP